MPWKNKGDGRRPVQIPATVHRDLKIEAAKSGKTIGEIITDLVRRWLQGNREK